jgi:hypothetical protein
MARVKNPLLFSSHFNISPDLLSEAGLIDPFLKVDTQLFIDPVLLEKSTNEIVHTEAAGAFHQHFAKFIRLLVISKAEGDAAWRGAQRLLNLQEPPENGPGYGGSGRSGSSRPDEVRDAIVRTANDIVDLGSRDPDMISLMGFFEENVGPDTISDFTTRVIVQQLSKITESFCLENGLAVKKLNQDEEFGLPCFRAPNGDERAIILVPCDIVRELPVANDWTDINAVASANGLIRDRVNLFLAGIAEPTVVDRKNALRRAATESAELFDLSVVCKGFRCAL